MYKLGHCLSVAALLLCVALPLSAQASDESKGTEAELRAEIDELKQRLLRLEALLTRDAEGAPTRAAAAPAGLAQPAAPAVRDESVSTDLVAGIPLRLPAAPVEAEPQDDVVVGPASTGGQPLTITGLVDTYFTGNFNNPDDGTNTLYYTNPNSRGFGLNQIKLELDAKGDGPIGFRGDIWFGSGARLFRDGLEPGALEDVIYLQQAYGYYQFDNGAELDVGLFGTIAGLEVAESHLNWNYTRGVLWAWNEPFSHLGAKFSAPITDTFTGTVMLVNGFDNAFDQNAGKSYGVQGSWAPNDRFNTTGTWIHGPENPLDADGWQRNFSWNFYGGIHPMFEIMGNFDYISNTDPTDVTATSWGFGGYARINPHERFKIAQRFEYFDDSEARSTGFEQILKEYTLTFEYAPDPNFITRFEYRRDWSTVPFFSSNNTAGIDDAQDTLTVGLMWIFGPTE